MRASARLKPHDPGYTPTGARYEAITGEIINKFLTSSNLRRHYFAQNRTKYPKEACPQRTAIGDGHLGIRSSSISIFNSRSVQASVIRKIREVYGSDNIFEIRL